LPDIFINDATQRRIPVLCKQVASGQRLESPRLDFLMHGKKRFDFFNVFFKMSFDLEILRFYRLHGKLMVGFCILFLGFMVSLLEII